MAGKGTVTVRKTGRMCVFSLYFKALDRKGVRKVFQNNFFLFVCLITDKSIMREKKRNKLPLKTIDLLIPDHAPVGGCVYVCVCVCVCVC